jgi:O-antigen/teichoic acid export membrane protein
MLISKVSQASVAFLTAILINRSLGPEGRGLFAEMQTWVALFIVAFGLSLDSVIYHFANKSEYPIDNNSFFTTIVLLSSFLSIVAISVLSLTSYFYPTTFSITTNSYLSLLILLIFFTILWTNLLVFQQSLGRIKLSAIVCIIQSFFQALIIYSGYAFHAINIYYIFVSLIIVQLTGIIIISLVSNAIFGSISFEIIIKMLKAGLNFHAATVSMFIYTKINQLILFKHCGEHDTGLFSISLNLAFAFMVIPATLQTVLYPRVIHSQDDYDITLKSLRFAFYGWGAIVFFIFLMAKPILLIYGGGEFLPSLNILRILLISTWILPLSSIIAPYCIKVGAFMACSISAVILGVMSIGLNLLLIPKYSGIGAAIATSLTCLVGFFLALGLLWILTKNNPLTFLILRP